MKTTIDIPEMLYKKAKIRAIERGQTLMSNRPDLLGKRTGDRSRNADNAHLPVGES